MFKLMRIKNKLIWLRNKLDLYGKVPQFYYNKEEKKNTFIGAIFSLLYYIICLAYLVYKIYKLIKHHDGEFMDSHINPENPQSIHLTNENFYVAFAIEDPVTYDTILDETIYYPKAYFKIGKRNDSNWNWESKELELEPCKLNKFGSKYKNIFAKKHLNVHYCFKEMNETLEGHFSNDKYSMLFISLFACKNSTENNNTCKSTEEIEKYLKGTFFTMQIQDILLTPNDYNEPIKGRDQDIYTTVGKKLFKEFHVFFEIVNIETDLDFIGIDEIKQVKNEKYIKYDSFNQMTKLLDKDVYETGESFCDVTLKLSDLVFYQKRKYTKLINILGDVGGLMETINDIFEFISSHIVDIIYETSLINALFELKKKDTKNLIFKNDKNCLNRIKKENLVLQKTMTYKKKVNNKIKMITQNILSKNINEKKNKISLDENYRQTSKDTIGNDFKILNITDQIYYIVENNYEKYNIPKKIIKHNKFCLYFCFLCISDRNEKNYPKQVNLIKENLDIITIIQKLYKLEKRNIDFEILQPFLKDINYDNKYSLKARHKTMIYHKK